MTMHGVIEEVDGFVYLCYCVMQDRFLNRNSEMHHTFIRVSKIGQNRDFRH